MKEMQDESKNSVDQEGTHAGQQAEASGPDTIETVPDGPAEAVENIGEQAQEKLRAELSDAKDKAFAEPVIRYLIRRCGEDAGLAADVLQESKTWEKCFNHIYSEARKRATGNRCAVRDDTVYEWAEDYYHAEEKSTKAPSASKSKSVEKKRTAAAAGETAPKRIEKPTVPKADRTPAPADKMPAPAPAPDPQKKRQRSKEIEGQMDIFSMLGL